MLITLNNIVVESPSATPDCAHHTCKAHLAGKDSSKEVAVSICFWAVSKYCRFCCHFHTVVGVPAGRDEYRWCSVAATQPSGWALRTVSRDALSQLVDRCRLESSRILSDEARELRSWDLKLGSWCFEPGTWDLRLGIWDLGLGSEI